MLSSQAVGVEAAEAAAAFSTLSSPAEAVEAGAGDRQVVDVVACCLPSKAADEEEEAAGETGEEEEDVEDC